MKTFIDIVGIISAATMYGCVIAMVFMQMSLLGAIFVSATLTFMGAIAIYSML